MYLCQPIIEFKNKSHIKWWWGGDSGNDGGDDDGDNDQPVSTGDLHPQ